MNEEQSDYDIWAIDPLSGERRNITNHPDVAWTYLAIDNKIPFISDRDTCHRCFFLYEMDREGKMIEKSQIFSYEIVGWILEMKAKK